ncbi:hypothetical protein M408DRAFT_248722 [Serendipita vermifera MAFF 305830]|uniref:Uncharacterized protein n=1 Tax=Serendipita vermifera MAFF 305830 TaxID=933852 RepID=A0A0C2WBS5_SERVB|nr:hypothetical protein M408DRAFT_248722 [Serendipita vermifera MAFF 305830]
MRKYMSITFFISAPSSRRRKASTHTVRSLSRPRRLTWEWERPSALYDYGQRPPCIHRMKRSDGRTGWISGYGQIGQSFKSWSERDSVGTSRGVDRCASLLMDLIMTCRFIS